MKTEIEMNKEASPNASLTELRFWGFIAILLAILTLWNTWTRPAQVDCAMTAATFHDAYCKVKPSNEVCIAVKRQAEIDAALYATRRTPRI